jgi:alpha-1,2-mannosyltransferase
MALGCVGVKLAAPARPIRHAAVLAVAALVALALHAWYGNRHQFFDLLIYRDAMQWWNGGNFLYDFWRPDATQGRLEFTYPPFAAFLLRPLGWLGTGGAIWAYSLTSLALLWVSLWWLVRPLADRYGQPRWFVTGLAFVAASGLEPIREAFTFGQINFLLWALVLLDLLVLSPRGSRWTGVGIGLATAIKLTPAIFIVYLLVTRRWRAGATAVAAAVGATLLAAAFAPRETWIFYTEKVIHAEGIGNLAYTFNQSVMGVLAKLAAPSPPSQLLWLLLMLPIVGYGLWRARHAVLAGARASEREHQQGMDEVAGLTLAGIVGSLLSPVTWAHHIFWLVPALVVLVDVALGAPVASGARRRGSIVLAAVTYLSVTFSLVALWDFTLDEPGGPLGFVLKNWYVLLMLALLPLLPVRSQVAVWTYGDSRRSSS